MKILVVLAPWCAYLLMLYDQDRGELVLSQVIEFGHIPPKASLIASWRNKAIEFAQANPNWYSGKPFSVNGSYELLVGDMTVSIQVHKIDSEHLVKYFSYKGCRKEAMDFIELCKMQDLIET